MTRIRFEPARSRDFAALQNDLVRFVDQIWGSQAEQPAKAAWSPALDVWETPEKIVLALDVPGVPQDRIAVELDGRRLTISGERLAEERAEGDRFYRFERRFGSFSRAVTLPEGVDESAITAAVRDGVLEIQVPKPAEQKPRRIDVQAARPDVEVGSGEAAA